MNKRNIYIGLLAAIGFASMGCQGVGFSSGASTSALVKAGQEQPPPPSSEECVAPTDGDDSSCRSAQRDNRCRNGGHSHERGEWGLCYLLAGPGVSQRIGYSDSSGSGSRYLVIESAISRDVCMSRNACLSIVNSYLNLTSGNLSGRPGQANNPLVQYTEFLDRSRSVCQHNPNVTRRNDGNIQSDISNLMRRALGN